MNTLQSEVEMADKITITCPTCHRPEEVDLPDDLIPIKEASRLTGRAISTIMTHVYKGRLREYPGLQRWDTRKYISQKELGDLYPELNATA